MCPEEVFLGETHAPSFTCAICGKPDIKRYVIIFPEVICSDCYARWAAWSSARGGEGQAQGRAMEGGGDVASDVVSPAGREEGQAE